MACLFLRIITMSYLSVLDSEIRNVLFNSSLKYVYVTIFFSSGSAYLKLLFKVANRPPLPEVENAYNNVVY